MYSTSSTHGTLLKSRASRSRSPLLLLLSLVCRWLLLRVRVSSGLLCCVLCLIALALLAFPVTGRRASRTINQAVVYEATACDTRANDRDKQINGGAELAQLCED